MLEKIWYENHPIKWLFWPLLWPLSLIFKKIACSRRHDFLLNKENSFRSSKPIVIVGNITAGGNGKTPVVIWLVETLQNKGYKVGVISRGYGGKAEEYPYRVDQTTTADISGDEPLLIYQRTSAPVVVAPIRSQAVKVLQDEVDLIIADDGLQHYQLDRDLEIVVIDAKRRFGNESYIPLGPLREGTERLKEVDLLISNGHSEQCDEHEKVMTLVPELAVNLSTGEKRKVSELGGLLAFAGIGHPQRFFDTLTSLGAAIEHQRPLADHQPITQSLFNEFLDSQLPLIMTEKDAVKCRHFATDHTWFLPVSAQFSTQDEQAILSSVERLLNDGV